MNLRMAWRGTLPDGTIEDNCSTLSLRTLNQSRTVVLNCLRGWFASRKSGMRMCGTSTSLLHAMEDQQDRLFESRHGLARERCLTEQLRTIVLLCGRCVQLCLRLRYSVGDIFMMR
ncbi:hypothetical protein RB9878 [Rhodopirellula baltica SH 1]|uniref:Uncharacterized protein n=1 Tax=Rhodopirellula baltica (strain DSM 10527 / NCIMB 13988 / SH1) TaxID=243090 RepID=Q7UKX3_RHOBA|nr:hypothetical protein RB9878 [Rhodopirellula baltica SH 1]